MISGTLKMYADNTKSKLISTVALPSGGGLTEAQVRTIITSYNYITTDTNTTYTFRVADGILYVKPSNASEYAVSLPTIDAYTKSESDTRYAKISDLFTEVGDSADVTSIPFVFDGYYDGKLGTFVYSTKSYSTDYIDINGATKILYTGSMGGEVANWFDDNRNYINQSNVYSGGVTLEKVNVLDYKPDNARYVRLASRNTNNTAPPAKTPEVLVFTGYDSGDRVNRLDLIEDNLKKLEDDNSNAYSKEESDHKYALKENLASLQNDFYTDVQSDIPFISGIYFDDGFKASDSNSSTDYIDIDELKGLLYTGSRPANVAAWFDANKTYIPPQNVYSGNNTLIDVDVLAYKPVDAKYVVLSSRNSNHSNPPKYGPRAVAIRNGNKVEVLNRT